MMKNIRFCFLTIRLATAERIICLLFDNILTISTSKSRSFNFLRSLIFAGAIGAVCLILLCPASIIASDNFGIDALLELEPFDWFNMPPSQVRDRCTVALANKLKLKDEQIFRLYLLRGIALLFEGKEKAAIRDLTEVLKNQPKNCQALRFRGEAYFVLDKCEEAQVDFETLINTQPKSAIGYACMARCLLAQGHLDDSKKYAEKAVKLDPDESQGYLAQAEAHLKSRNYRQAIKDLEQCIALSFGGGTTMAARPYLLRAATLLNIFDNPKKAFPDLLMVLRLDPDAADIKVMFCEYYFKTGKYKMAFRLSKQIKDDQGRSQSDLRCRQVECLLERNKNAEALRLIESVIRQDPKWWANYIFRGEVFFSQKRYSDALQDYNKSLSLNNDNLSAMAAKAYILSTCPEMQVRDGQTARKLAIKCCERTEYQVPRRLMLLAMACAECGDYKEAVRWAKKSLEKADPGFPFLADYRKRLALFEQEKPFRFFPDSPVFDYLCP
jgi:tetratricopeptide (TPR) repeat protein